MNAKKKSYHKGNVREGLIQAAEGVLRHEDLGQLSLRRVAREVGVAPSAVYNHFKNREALLVAVAADGYRQLSDLELKRYAEAANPAQALQMLARDYLRFAAANPELYRLMFSPEVARARIDPELNEAGDTSFRLSVDWWYGEGAYDPASSATRYPYALSAWALLHGLALQIIDGLVTLDREQGAEIDALADSAMGVLLEGAAGGLPKKT